MNTKQKLIERLQAEISVTQLRIQQLQSIEGLEALELEASTFCDFLDFDNLPHAEVMKVMSTLKAGKWEKTPADNGTIHYTTKIGDLNVRCYSGEPPPNCKIVEYLEEVPAQPAKMVTKRKLVCQ